MIAETQSAPPPRGAAAMRQSTTLRAIVATSGLFGLFPLSLSPIMVAAGQRGGLSEIEAGSWVTSMLLGVAASAIGLGALSERLALRNMLTVGVGLVVVVQALLLGFAQLPLALLCLLSFISGLGSGCGIVAGDVILARARNPMATAGAAMAITSTLMLGVFPVGMWLTATLGMGAIPLLASASALISLALTAGIDFEKLRGARGAVALGRRRFDLAAMLLLACLFFFWARDGMVWSFAAIRAEQIGFAPESIGLVLGLAGACGIIGSAFSALLAHARPIAPNILVLAAIPPALAASTWALTGDPFGFAGLQLSYNALQLFAYPLIIGFAAQKDGSGRLAAVAGGMTLLGAAAGPIIGGTASAIGGSGGLASAVATISLASVLTLALAVISPQMRALQRQPGSVPD